MITREKPGCDVLVVSPHTDDAEIGLGGTLAMLAARGRRVWCLDLTRGELGTNDSGDLRWDEAAAAARILGLTGRVQLNLPDGFISPDDRVQAEAVVWMLRTLRPRWVLTAPDAVRHPDHVATPKLVERACFLARLAALVVDEPVWRVWTDGGPLPEMSGSWITEAVFAVCAEHEKPQLLFDVTDHWASKKAALDCYASQFKPAEGRRPTMINDPAFLERIERRARHWGHRSGCHFAEALRTLAVPVMQDLPPEPWRG